MNTGLAYGAVGLGHFTAFTRWPPLKPWVDAAYALFARHRYFVSRLATPLILWLAARRDTRNTQACKTGECPIPPTQTRKPE